MKPVFRMRVQYRESKDSPLVDLGYVPLAQINQETS